MSELTKSFVETVAQKIIEQLKAGTAPWLKPWQPGESESVMPVNPITGNHYKGINALHLMCQGRDDQRWMTYKQAESAGAQVRRGEKGTPIQYWQFSEERTKTDENDRPVLGAEGKPVKYTVRLERPALYMATVFNAEQIDGLPLAQARKPPAWQPIERAEQILEASRAKIQHDGNDNAYYRPQTDSIHLPDKGQFERPDQYYATALHELGHWTGHPSRLDRDLAHPFGSEGYAKEELRAEIGSMMLGAEIGIGHDPRQHMAYVGSWIKAIENDPLEIFRAAADADKIREFVLGIEQKRVHDLALPEQAQQVADFIAANQNLLPAKVAENTLAAPEQLRAILADDARMKVLDAPVNDLLQGINQTYIDQTKAAIASAVAWGSTGERQYFDAPDQLTAGQLKRDARAVATFIAANLNLLPEKVAENTLQAPEDLQKILRSSEHMRRLEPAVNGLLENLNQAYIDQTQAVIATTLGRPDAPEREERARQSWAARQVAPRSDIDEAQLVADFIAANHNLYPEAIAVRAMDAPPELRSVLQDTQRMGELQGRVSALLEGIDPEYAIQAGAIAELMSLAVVQGEYTFADEEAATMAKLNFEAPRLPAWRMSPELQLSAGETDIALAMRALGSASRSEREKAAAAFEQTVETQLDLHLPAEWTGNVAIIGNLIDPPEDSESKKWQVAAESEGGAIRAVCGMPTRYEAEQLADRLKLIAAYAANNANEQAAKLARIHEDAVRRDPALGEDDFIVAREIRRHAERVVEHGDVAGQRRFGHDGRATAAQTMAAASLASGVDTVVQPGAPDELQSQGIADWRLSPELQLSDADMEVAQARLQLATCQPSERHIAVARSETAGDTFAASNDLHTTLPNNWTGAVVLVGEVVDLSFGAASNQVFVPAMGEEPQYWNVAVGIADDRSYRSLKHASDKDDAEQLAARLKLIDAYSTESEYEKAAKLAHIHEDAVKRNPDSTSEDLAAAREIRKQADFLAAQNDTDLQRRIKEEEGRAALNAELELDELAPRRFIDVPFAEKDKAKALGARWDRQEQSWYIPVGADEALFSKYAQQGPKSSHSEPDEGRLYLAVPYADRHHAKAAGAAWDKRAKCWFAPTGADLGKLAQWRPENVHVQQDPAMSPREEFAHMLRRMGCEVTGEHPIMDGKKHRITVSGDKFSEHSGAGFYVAHLDGHPAGYIKNNKSGRETHWKAKGYVLDARQKAALRANAISQVQERDKETLRQHEMVAERVKRQASKLVPVVQPTPYMRSKGIKTFPGVLTDQVSDTTYVPALDTDGKQWSTQYIGKNGMKRFAKGGRKTGCFHPVGGMDALAKAPALVIAEGYATACSLAEVLGHATVAAFDSGNLPHVAQALHKKYPGKPVIIAGDNDRDLEAAHGVNPGREKAQEAARLTGGRAVLPIFSPDDRGNGFTDFNDMAVGSVMGRDAVYRQVKPVVTAEVERLRLEREQWQRRQQEHGQRASLKFA